MQTKVQKWGNSLAVRIPKAFAEETGLDMDSAVDIQVVDGHIHIIPVKKPTYKLADLLENITLDNLHGELDTGDAIGNEAW